MSPKLKVKPTPAQARLIKAMGDNDGMAVVPYERRAEYCDLNGGWYRGQWKVEKSYGKPRVSTVKRCIAEGWLVDPDPESGRWAKLYVLSDDGLEVYRSLEDEDLVPKNLGVSTLQIIDALRKRHQRPEWLFAYEVNLGTGFFSSYNVPGLAEPISFQQRIDAFALNCYASRRFRTVAYEIKLTRADFQREIDHPTKRQAAMLFANYCYFAAPAGLIKPDEVPEPWGLVEVWESLTVRTKVEAKLLQNDKPAWPFVAAFGRALADRP